MKNHTITYLSSDNQNKELMNRSVEILKEFFKNEKYIFDKEQGKVLFIASGGSEQNAVKLTKSENNVTLLCHRESNSYAATIEIAAYLRAHGKRASIIDVFAPSAYDEFIQIQKIHDALDSLANKKAALIGEVSDWLIISDIETKIIKDKLGVEMLRLPWSELGDYKEKEASQEFLKHFPNQDPAHLNDTAKVYALLKEVIDTQKLSAISVECFSMVIRDKVTACLPLAVLNNNGSVAACEGDIVSMIGKMLISAISDTIPWQANVANIEGDTVLFAHCTAPLNLLKSFEITTHYETNCGTAVQGEFAEKEVGVFRVNSKLDKYMLLEGEVVNTPKHNFACRTQIEFKTTQQQADLLKNNSLGNHHLIFPKADIPVLVKMMSLLNIERVIPIIK